MKHPLCIAFKYIHVFFFKYLYDSILHYTLLCQCGINASRYYKQQIFFSFPTCSVEDQRKNESFVLTFKLSN